MMNPITRYIIKRRMKKGGLKFTRDELLKSRPVRNSLIKWDKSEKDIVSLVVPQKRTLWIKVISAIFMLPRSRVILLDDVGSYVWTLCDGHNSIDSVVRALCNRYKLTRKEAETSLLVYFRKLGRRGIIVFAVPKAAEQDTEKTGMELRA